jgi:CBS domain containing-hemolysin-like protein
MCTNAGAGMDGPLSLQEMGIISGVLELTATPVASMMTPISEAQPLAAEAEIDAAMVDSVLRHGMRQVLVQR